MGYPLGKENSFVNDNKKLFANRSIPSSTGQLFLAFLMLTLVFHRYESWPLFYLYSFAAGFFVTISGLLVRLFWSVFDELHHKLEQYSRPLILFSCLGWVICNFSLIFADVTEMESQIFSFFLVSGLASSAIYSLGFRKDLFYSFVGTLLSAEFIMLLFLPLDGVVKTVLCMMIFAYVGFLYKTQDLYYRDWMSLIESKNKLKKIIDGFPGGISLLKNHNYAMVNRYVAESFQKSEKDYSDLEVNFSHRESHFVEQLNSFHKGQEEEKSYSTDLHTKNGVRRHLITLKRFNWEEFDTLIVSIDMEDLHQAQIEIEKQRVQLQASTKMAALGEMASSLAHEINTPLSIIDLRARKMVTHLKSAKVYDKFSENQMGSIIATIERIAKIIKGLRVFARDANSDPFEICSLNEIVDNTLALCKAKLDYNNIVLHVDIPTSINISCRSVQICQVLLNLIHNSLDAVKNTSDKRITIKAEETNDSVNIYVEDSGAGISNEIKDKIFHPLFTTKSPGEGTGLGLSISKGIIDSHKGQIYFDSNTSVGAKVVIQLPKVKQTYAA